MEETRFLLTIYYFYKCSCRGSSNTLSLSTSLLQQLFPSLLISTFPFTHAHLSTQARTDTDTSCCLFLMLILISVQQAFLHFMFHFEYQVYVQMSEHIAFFWRSPLSQMILEKCQYMTCSRDVIISTKSSFLYTSVPCNYLYAF